MRPSLVADPNDPRVALYRGARDPELLSAHGLFIAEGRLIVQRLLDRSAFRVRSVLCTPTAFGAMQDVFDSSQSEILLVDQDVMDAITTFNIHRGCLALAERGTGTPLDRLLTTDGPLVVLENVGNPDNVGGVFRNAAAFGASGVLLSPGCTDPLYRKAIRTSMGATLTTPFVADVPWPQALDALRAAEWSLIALTPAGDREIADAARQLPVDGRVALLCGHEGDGLSEAALARATLSARIAMVPEVDSLNVATAAAVALYALSEVRGQRSGIRGEVP